MKVSSLIQFTANDGDDGHCEYGQVNISLLDPSNNDTVFQMTQRSLWAV
jgi:hypothetical protein